LKQHEISTLHLPTDWHSSFCVQNNSLRAQQKSLMLKYPKRPPLDYKYAITIVATAELDPQSPDMAYTASSEKETTIRGPMSLAQMANAIAGTAAAASVAEGKVVLNASAVLTKGEVTLEMGSAGEEAKKGLQASGHVLWGERGVTPLWGCSLVSFCVCLCSLCVCRLLCW
jgi:hypothetical protein